ncbi:MAG: hypothetical protein IKG66_00995 [Lachnospiraceae bacterium]|nr:hypothetical protein [Lachnospiraceae bacterium]
MTINGKHAEAGWPVSAEETQRIEQYFRENERACRFMSAEDFAEHARINGTAAKHILESFSKEGITMKMYAIFCPSCGKIADRGAYPTEIRKSGYRCPWCGKRVEYEPQNLGNLYYCK